MLLYDHNETRKSQRPIAVGSFRHKPIAGTSLYGSLITGYQTNTRRGKRERYPSIIGVLVMTCLQVIAVKSDVVVL
jgi:hypothetical protein